MDTHDLADLQKRPRVDIRVDIANKGDCGWPVVAGPTELGSHRVLRQVAVDTKSKGCWNGEDPEVRRVLSSGDAARVASDCAEELDRAAEARPLQGLMAVEEGLLVMLRRRTGSLEEAENWEVLGLGAGAPVDIVDAVARRAKERQTTSSSAEEQRLSKRVGALQLDMEVEVTVLSPGPHVSMAETGGASAAASPCRRQRFCATREETASPQVKRGLR